MVALALLLLVLAAGLIFGLTRGHSTASKRLREDQIVCCHDSSTVELYYHNPYESRTVDIRAELCVGDGPIEIARGQVKPGETVTALQTRDGEPFDHFVAAIFSGRILVYDLESGRLLDRIEPLELRIYESSKDPYDSIAPLFSQEREPLLDEVEHRPKELKMKVDLKTEELSAGIYGLCAEWRDLKCYVYAEIDGQEVLVAKDERVGPRCIVFQLYLEPGIADMMEEGDYFPVARVDSYYADTGEFYDSIPAEIYQVVRTS